MPENQSPADSEAADPTAPQAKKARPTKYLPTGRVRFPKQTNLILAYGVVHQQTGEPVTNKEAGETAKLTASTAALLNAFLTANKFIVKAKGKDGFVPAPEVIEYAKAHDWDPDGAIKKLEPLVSRTWFAKAIVPHIRIHERDEDEVVRKLAEVCSASPDYRSQVTLLLDYLHAAGVVEREGGVVRLARQSDTSPPPNDPDKTPKTPAPMTPPVALQTPTTSASAGMRFAVSFDIDMGELSTWQPSRIAAFMDGVAKVLSAKGGLDRSEGTKE